MKNNNSLFFTCSLIEFIGRRMKKKRSDTVKALGDELLTRILRYADVLHCEPIERVADEFISLSGISEGSFDNAAQCRYRLPDCWDIGEVYCRLIEDILDEGENSVNEILSALKEVYSSEISDRISDYNTDFYYQSRNYIKACYLAGEILE